MVPEGNNAPQGCQELTTRNYISSLSYHFFYRHFDLCLQRQTIARKNNSFCRTGNSPVQIARFPQLFVLGYTTEVPDCLVKISLQSYQQKKRPRFPPLLATFPLLWETQAVFWPSLGAEICVPFKQLGLFSSIICPGNTSQRSVVDKRPESSTEITSTKFLTCAAPQLHIPQ